MELVLDIEGFKISAKTWGDKTGQPLLAIHGWLDNANTFDKIAPLLSEDIYLVALDLAGHGFSDHRSVNDSYYLWDYAIDILNVVSILKWKNFSILAHSMGTGVAAIIAAAMPEFMDRLVFIDGLGAPFVINEGDVVSNFRKSTKQLKMAKKTKLFGFSSTNSSQFDTREEAIKDRMKSNISSMSYDASACLIGRSLSQTSNGYRWRYDPRIALPECYKMTERQAQLFIEKISCEVLVILGKEGLFSNGMFSERLKRFKKASVHWVTGGHHLHLEETHIETSTLINQFLQTEF
ncbi:alpha/beta hydrolase [Aquimarina sp. AD1]|uniref:alpha/beta fold hydrolase n=1 Tax=Aquimarina sp. (strain AD1) TaxID=1714848 RepID=UPI000E5250AE|nr:alpha/beta hydrolase [Aquimarina sp. AD1]AXT55440.1 alpha/beta hydrolase [Aquimarina sp. AD1]RKN26348.1 alpha/beta fold hydrolase [Aquimarina sp. AD1]